MKYLCLFLLACIVSLTALGCVREKSITPDNIQNVQTQIQRIKIICTSIPDSRTVWLWDFSYRNGSCFQGSFNGHQLNEEGLLIGSKLLMNVFVANLSKRPSLDYENGFASGGDRYTFIIYSPSGKISRSYANPHSQISETGLLITAILDSVFDTMAKDMRSDINAQQANPLDAFGAHDN